jgi:hypothetical protein
VDRGLEPGELDIAVAGIVHARWPPPGGAVISASSVCRHQARHQESPDKTTSVECYRVFMSRRLAIDFEAMQTAFEDRDGEGRWFLDTETGDVVRIEAGIGDRYRGIPYQGLQASQRDRAEFIGSVNDNKLRALLDVAGREASASARFENVLQAFPDERARWLSFQKMCVRHRIRRWLASENIDPIAPRPSTN